MANAKTSAIDTGMCRYFHQSDHAGAAAHDFRRREQTRAFSYVDDIAPQIASAPECGGGAATSFNVGADVPYSVNALADTIRTAMGVPDHPIVHHPERNEVKHAFSDHSRVKSVFGNSDSGTSLDHGVGRMIAWAQEHGPRTSARFEQIEIERNLPASWRDG